MEEHKKKGWDVVDKGGREDSGMGGGGPWRSRGRRDRRWWVIEEYRKEGWNVVGDGRGEDVRMGGCWQWRNTRRRDGM